MIKLFFLTLATSFVIHINTLPAEVQEEDHLEAEVQGGVQGKVDVGPIFVHIDILESGRTVNRMDMMGGRFDFSYFLHRGLYVKPTVMYANAGSNRGELFTASLGLGYLFPVAPQILVAPSFGANYSHIWTRINFIPLQLKDLKETFNAWAPFIELDIYYTFMAKWRLCYGIQYSWSRSHITVEKLAKYKSKSQGFAHSILLEHDLSDQWSWNIGAAYNLSLSKEKHGLRGTGVKTGIVRWF